MFWEVACIQQNNRVYIIHYKKQEATSTNPQEYFKFMWEFRLIFNETLTECEDTSMGISSIEFGKECTAEIKEEVKKGLSSLQYNDCKITVLD